MGRSKTYDRDTVLRKAMELFWTQGYSATSTKALAAHMGINAYSLFAEFESKQGLYKAALALYRHEVVTGIFAALDRADAGLDEILDLLEFFAERACAPSANRGCLASNAACERGASDPASQAYFAEHIERIEALLRKALVNAQARGKLRPDVSCVDEARLLAMVVLGFTVSMRAEVDGERVVGAARAARSDLLRLCT
jgi:TetR/AcrR family transcriptional repressor of nem operon